MKREDFFRQIIDNYLFLDLKNMSGLRQKDGEDGGAAGYPMLATCVSGIELLGGLLYPKDYNHSNDWIYFEHYWNYYLAKHEPKYTPYAKLFWKLVRNGVAHTYVAKAAITVTKDDRSHHLVFHEDGKRFNVDCVVFYEDFQKSYIDLVAPKLRPNDRFTGQIDKNITAMLSESESLCNEVLKEFLDTTDKTAQVGATGSPITTPSGVELHTETTTVIPNDIRHKIEQAQKNLHISSASRISGASLMTQEAAEQLKKSEQEDNDWPKLSGL